MKILVTGSDGFIGRNMMGWLASEGWEVTGWEWDEVERPDVRNYDWVVHLGAIAGANRGLGLAFAREALARGARTVYTGVRNPSKLTPAGAEAINLAVTRPADACHRRLHLA